jgi:hypothetical protein
MAHLNPRSVDDPRTLLLARESLAAWRGANRAIPVCNGAGEAVKDSRGVEKGQGELTWARLRGGGFERGLGFFAS